MMGSLRITSGRFRGRVVRTPEGEGTRPLLTRVRKSLVDILRPSLPRARLLDLFGGSGAISFELLSNGAASAVVYELSSPTANLIRQNAQHLGVEIVVRTGDALDLVAGESGTFDIVVVAPPYGLGLQQLAVDRIAGSSLLAADGTLVVQRDRQETETVAAGELYAKGTRAYGRTVFEFFSR